MLKLKTDTIYNDWDKLAPCKINLGGETTWGRIVDGEKGLRGIDNNPLTEDFHWQDIIDRNNKIVHRRWIARLWFRYNPATTEAKDIRRRGRVLKALQKFGDVNFWSPGLGFIWVKAKDDQAPAQIESIIESLNFK